MRQARKNRFGSRKNLCVPQMQNPNGAVLPFAEDPLLPAHIFRSSQVVRATLAPSNFAHRGDRRRFSNRLLQRSYCHSMKQGLSIESFPAPQALPFGEPDSIGARRPSLVLAEAPLIASPVLSGHAVCSLEAHATRGRQGSRKRISHPGRRRSSRTSRRSVRDIPLASASDNSLPPGLFR